MSDMEGDTCSMETMILLSDGQVLVGTQSPSSIVKGVAREQSTREC